MERRRKLAYKDRASGLLYYAIFHGCKNTLLFYCPFIEQDGTTECCCRMFLAQQDGGRKLSSKSRVIWAIMLSEVAAAVADPEPVSLPDTLPGH